MHYAASKKKQKELEEFLQTPLVVGEYVSVPGAPMGMNENRTYTCKVEEISEDKLVVHFNGYRSRITINKTDVAARNARHIGADPFDKGRNRVRLVAFPVSSIIHTLDLLGERRKEKCDTIEGIEVPECNWDPYVYLPDGTKHRYQRPFVWTRPQKQALVSSIYNGIDCGKVIVRARLYHEVEQMAKNGETELAFHDIVDGKQRLDAVRGFMQGEFKDVHGNFYADLSNDAQHHFTDHQLFSYGVMENDPTDAEVLQQFLKLNFTGVPQSPKHLKYVDGLYRKLG